MITGIDVKSEATGRGGERWRWGVLFKLESLWVGVYYSAKNQRWCINPVPCVTFWVTKPCGRVPSGPDFDDKLTRILYISNWGIQR
jgi:hypothetical protein